MLIFNGHGLASPPVLDLAAPVTRLGGGGDFAKHFLECLELTWLIYALASPHSVKGCPRNCFVPGTTGVRCEVGRVWNVWEMRR